MAGRQGFDPFEDTMGGEGSPVGEDLPQCLDVQASSQCRVGEQRLHLGGKIQPIASDGIEQGADARAIAGQHQATFRLVPQGDGELTVQVFDEVVAVLLVKMDDDLRVRTGVEAVTQRLELLTQLDIVEDLSIEDYLDGAILVVDGLITPLQVDDAQPRMGQTSMLIVIVAVAVGAPVVQTGDHGLQLFSRRRRQGPKIEYSCYSTHELIVV